MAGAGGGMPPGLMLPTRRKVVIMLAVMVSLFLAALDMTIWGVAAPKAVGDLGRLDLFAWPLTSYLLGSTVLVPIIGKLSDIYGRKPFLVAGILIFLVASLLCGIAGSMWELIGFRLLQGCGAAFIMANAFTVMGDYFAPAERPRWAGIVAGVFALASIIGPLVGGVLTDYLSWRWVFYINIPVGGVALLLTLVLVPWYHGEHREPVDWSGAHAADAGGGAAAARLLAGRHAVWLGRLAGGDVLHHRVRCDCAVLLARPAQGQRRDHAAADVPQPHLSPGHHLHVRGGHRDDGHDVRAALLPAGRAGHLRDQFGSRHVAHQPRNRARLDFLRPDHGPHRPLQGALAIVGGDWDRRPRCSCSRGSRSTRISTGRGCTCC